MGSSKGIIGRASQRIVLSSAGEVVGRAVNLLLPFALFSIHSVSATTDIFFLIMAVAFFAQGTLTNAIINALVPELIKNKEIQNIRVFLVWTIIASLLAGLVAALLISEQPWVHVALSSGAVVLMASTSLAAAPAVAVLYANHRYGIPGLTWGLRIIPVALYIFLRPTEPALHWLLTGLALADTGRMIILVFLTRGHYCLQTHSKSLQLPLSAHHLILASVIAGFTPLIVRWIASIGDDGGVSIFEAADRLYAAIASLSTIGVGNVTLVYLARLTNTPEEERGWQLIWKISLAWSFLWLILGFFLWFIFPSLTTWVEVQTKDVLIEIRHTFLTLTLGLPGFIMTNVLSRRILTLGYSHTLVKMALIGLASNCVAGTLLFNSMGTMGIGLALSINQYIIVAMMAHQLSAHRSSSYKQ